MAGLELTRTVQESFASGMVRAGRPEQIPSDGAEDITNGLLDLSGGVFKRGGTAYRGVQFGSGLRLIWDGWLTNGGQTTLLASTSSFGRLKEDGSVDDIGGGGLPEPGKPAAFNGTVYFPGGVTFDGTTLGAAAKTSELYAVVANRLLVAEGQRVAFSKINTPGTFEATDYHQLPGGIAILGIEALRQSAVVFTTGGVWVISGMAKNLTDENGNVQQTLDLYSSDLVLWGSAGIAAWEGGLIVPGTDGVYLVQLGETSEKAHPFTRISDTIESLYREYVKLGYSVGQATVFANHYILPIVAGGQVIDVLVCRLDLVSARAPGRRPWTHLSGFGAEVGAFCVRPAASAGRNPELLGAMWEDTSRALTCYYFQPTEASQEDADGSTPTFSLTTRSYPTGNLRKNLVNKLRLGYQMFAKAGEPKLKLAVAYDTPPKDLVVWGGFEWGGKPWGIGEDQGFEALAIEAPPDTNASKPFTWRLHRKRRFARFKISSASAGVMLAIKSLELYVRPEGRI